MAARNYILATAGHVDHGKSALVKALTGHDPDRLPEEKARGITIDLGFGHLRLASGLNVGRDLPIPPDQSEAAARQTAGCGDPALHQRRSEDPTLSGGVLNVGIVDVPGHEDFIKNMVAGIGAVDAALLVVAADDGWMPQSEEHLQILEYAGVRHGIVALTKIDRIDVAARPAAIASVRTKLAGTALAEAPIVPTSVQTGEGIDDLRRRIAETLAGSPQPRDLAKPRLWVDRAFTLHGIGTVVTGSLRGGELEAGQLVALAGQGAAVRIRTIHQHNAAQAKALPGTRTALNLLGVATAGDETSGMVHRGDLITLPAIAAAHDTCDVVLIRSGRTELPSAAGHVVTHGARLRLHVGTASVGCRVIFADRRALLPGEQCVAQLRLEAALPLADGERVILRDPAGQATLAGGTVLETGTGRGRFRTPAQQAFLAAQATHLEDCRGSIEALLRRDGFCGPAELHRCCRFADAEISAATAALTNAGTVIGGDGWIGLTERWTALRAKAIQLIAAHERQHPTQNGLPLTQLRLALDRRMSGGVFQALVAELAANDFETVGAAIRHGGFRPALPQSLQPVAEQLAAALRRARLNPPLRKDVARGAEATEALEFLIKTGRVVALTADLALAANVYHAATRAVCDHLHVCGRATVSELKQALGVSRRVMVPLLERMDREGLTIRDGEHRVLRKAPAQAVGNSLAESG